MQATQGRLGRVFILRLEDGDVLPDTIEAYAAKQNIKAGFVTLVGGVIDGEIVAGPRNPSARPLQPISVPVENAHEVSASGVIAPGSDGKPVLHLHGALGRSGHSLAGCLRSGVKTWLVGEAILYEIVDANVVRKLDDNAGLNMLTVTGPGATEAAPAPTATPSRVVEQPAPAPSPEKQAAAAMAAAPAPQAQPKAPEPKQEWVEESGPRSRVVHLFRAEIN